jgi:hypothetical protein
MIRINRCTYINTLTQMRDKTTEVKLAATATEKGIKTQK